MPYFLVPIHGSADRAAGQLARAGIHSQTQHLSGTRPQRPESERRTTARLSAETREDAEQRVRDALGDGGFSVQRAELDRPELAHPE
jgi:hypothetical protein